MQEFLSIKVCIKLSIPYLSLHLWPQVCGSFLLMYERKSISHSNLQGEPNPVLAVPPGCRCCPRSLLVLQQLWPWRGQQWCAGTDLGSVGFHTRCPSHCWNGAWWSLSPPWVCARPAVPLTALNYRWHHCTQCFHHTAQALWKCFKATALEGWRAPPNSGTCTQWL